MTFKEQIQQGIPAILPSKKHYDISINHAPKRKEILSADEKKLALRMLCVILKPNIMLNYCLNLLMS